MPSSTPIYFDSVGFDQLLSFNSTTVVSTTQLLSTLSVQLSWLFGLGVIITLLLVIDLTRRILMPRSW